LTKEWVSHSFVFERGVGAVSAGIAVKAAETANRICPEFNVYLYDVEYVKEGKAKTLRVYIDRDGGVFIDDCEAVSRKLSVLLDEENLISDAYNLEVSSPGVERKLSKDWHFQKVMGKKIELSLYAPIDGKKSYSGILTDYGDKVIISENGKSVEFEKAQISSAKLCFEFN
jgi:ribosome maturation factor RimP